MGNCYRDKWFGKPLENLRGESKIEGLTVLDGVQGEVASNKYGERRQN